MEPLQTEQFKEGFQSENITLGNIGNIGNIGFWGNWWISLIQSTENITVPHTMKSL